MHSNFHWQMHPRTTLTLPRPSPAWTQRTLAKCVSRTWWRPDPPAVAWGFCYLGLSELWECLSNLSTKKMGWETAAFHGQPLLFWFGIWAYLSLCSLAINEVRYLKGRVFSGATRKKGLGFGTAIIKNSSPCLIQCPSATWSCRSRHFWAVARILHSWGHFQGLKSVAINMRGRK